MNIRTFEEADRTRGDFWREDGVQGPGLRCVKLPVTSVTSAVALEMHRWAQCSYPWSAELNKC